MVPAKGIKCITTRKYYFQFENHSSVETKISPFTRIEPSGLENVQQLSFYKKMSMHEYIDPLFVCTYVLHCCVCKEIYIL